MVDQELEPEVEAEPEEQEEEQEPKPEATEPEHEAESVAQTQTLDPEPAPRGRKPASKDVAPHKRRTAAEISQAKIDQAMKTIAYQAAGASQPARARFQEETSGAKACEAST